MTLELVPPVGTEGPPLVGQLTIGALLGLVVAGVLLVIIVLLMLLAAAMWYQRRSRKKKGPTILSNDFEFENMGVVRAPLIFPNVVTISPTIFIHASYNSLTLLPYPLSFLQYHLCLRHYIITVSSLYISSLHPLFTSFLHHSYILLHHSYIIPTSFLQHSYIILTSFLHHSYIILISFLHHSTSFLHHSYIILTAFLHHSYIIPTLFLHCLYTIPTLFLHRKRSPCQVTVWMCCCH